MLTLVRRARPALRPLLARAASGHGAGTTPDTGGPLFSTQFGVPIHKPGAGGDKAAAKRDKPPADDKKPASKHHKVQGGYSFAELKRLHQDGRD
ncbi:hypothetical protein CC85DRAFT_301641 [Cutaneotrichosporon oleaginosum]|uniref:Uncharacterized protein n=1 Tax=Cutaneotrichosporon oleaginosum TaxID=879819 RepID=A0A0J1B695_9TREE|nr:uncharacterized protein CC85DRAFT_301641 [Cutaneotrichosporon oleaginosum]KLT43244.1 hypothetical protein CC85DRAFT_301641 [Cutaneotrichosporon oleaginosum]